MDAHKVEAMLLEANINTSSSCFGISTNFLEHLYLNLKESGEINFLLKNFLLQQKSMK
jgi:hypothetical protein